jgi:uncharacterized membrane protein
MSTGRLEAFSDGVIAIAITLLVLDIAVPPAGTGRLGHQLLEQWPSYAAYVVSFLTIGVIWINHHAAIARLVRADHALLVLNLLLLMTIAALPFTTALMAEYLRVDDGQHLAAAVYAGSLLVMSLAFYALQRHILVRAPHLLDERLDAATRRRVRARNLVGLAPYVLAIALAPVSSYATLAVCGAVGVYYALPGTTGADRPEPAA